MNKCRTWLNVKAFTFTSNISMRSQWSTNGRFVRIYVWLARHLVFLACNISYLPFTINYDYIGVQCAMYLIV